VKLEGFGSNEMAARGQTLTHMS